MKILSKIGRKPGEVIELGDAEYAFSQDNEGRFYLEVEEQAHCERLLSITEAFGLYPEPGQPVRKTGGKKQAPGTDKPPVQKDAESDKDGEQQSSDGEQQSSDGEQ